MMLKQLTVKVEGQIQGVGFRPFIFKLAHQFQQLGYVANHTQGVEIVIQGQNHQQQAFLNALQSQLPPFAEIHRLAINETPLSRFTDFQIIPSQTDGKPSAFIMPDLAPCPACISDLNNPNSRFYRYPFTSCCHCGPRYSIIEKQPFDRANTSMAAFRFCPTCEQDYQTRNNRRFHAQTLSCPTCGPSLRFISANGVSNDDPIKSAIALLKAGKILALKGIGGFQLLVSASNQAAVERLRQRKQRPHKPLALMVANLNAAEQLGFISELEQNALTSAAAPIVLLQRRATTNVAKAVADNNQLLGIMLPASPLHYLIAQAIPNPLVVTSGNRHHQALCIDNQQALNQLAEIADGFLLHDRVIQRPVDDAVVRVIAGKATVLRLGRGYAPLTIATSSPLVNGLALGGHLKNSLAFSVDQQIINSQHLGDLDNPDNQRHALTAINDLQQLYGIQNPSLIHDLHPDYFGSRYAHQQHQSQAIQHHHAHILACMAEHQLQPPVLGFAWDGSGLGSDGLTWGSETLLISTDGYQRLAHLRRFTLIGGDSAAREPRRAALALLSQLYGDQLSDQWACLQSFEPAQRPLLKQMLAKNLNCPLTTSAGRLFDAIASLLDICQINHYEGQAAMQLEQQAHLSSLNSEYPFKLSDTTPSIIDWEPLIEALLLDLNRSPIHDIAAKFHNTLATIILQLAQRAKVKCIALSGGCFQNACLTAKTVNKLEAAGFTVYRHQKLPPNDGSLAAGQLYAASINTAVINRS